MKCNRTYRSIAFVACAIALLYSDTLVHAQLTDTSDSLFSIVVPSGLGRDIDMGSLAVGSVRDSLVSPFFINTGRAAIRADSMYITGADASDFSIVAGAAPFRVGTGSAHAAGFQFAPAAPGNKHAVIVLHTQIDTQRYAIRGEAVSPRVEIVTNIVDFGRVRIGGVRDSVVEILLRNIGALPLSIETAQMAGPDIEQFSIRSSDVPVTLPPLATHGMTLRFAPNMSGRSSGSVRFGIAGYPDHPTAQLFGEGVSVAASAVLSTDTIDANIGSIVSIPIRLTDQQNVQLSGAVSMYTELCFDASVLVPVAATPAGILENGLRVIPLHGLPLMPDADAVLARIDVMPTLGYSDATVLTLRNSAAIGADVSLLELPGLLRIVDICPEGGERFFDASQRFALQQNHPNPFNTTTVIDFELPASGHALLRIYDKLGRPVATLVDDYREAGTHRIVFDAGDLPTATYTCMLSMGIQRRMIRLHLLK